MRSEPAFGAEYGERVECAPSRRFRTLYDGELGAENPRVHEPTVVVARELSGRARPMIVDDDSVQRIMRRIRSRQGEAELVQTRVDGAHRGPPSLASRNESTSVPCQR